MTLEKLTMRAAELIVFVAMVGGVAILMRKVILPAVLG